MAPTMLRRHLACALLVVVVATSVACESSDPKDEGFPLRTPESTPTTSSGPVIGLVGSMADQHGWRGDDAFEGADVAVQALNRRSGDTEQQFTLVGLDDEGNPERATELIEELASSDRTVGIIYAGPPEGAAAAEPALAQAGIPAVIVYGDLYSERLLRPHLFQVSPPLLWEARRIADYLLTDRRYRRVGLLTEDSLTGDTAVDSARAALKQYDARAAVTVSYSVADVDLADEIDMLEDADVEAIVFQGAPAVARLLFDELEQRDAAYRTTDEARTVTATKKQRRRNTGWHPQVAAFDGVIDPETDDDGEIPAGTVAADTYARGAHYLPIPSLREFRDSFEAWWDESPTGWQRRAYEATSMIGWAARHTPPGDDVAVALESLKGERFGGLEVTFGPDDHTSVIPTTVGLWVVPRPSLYVRERSDLPEEMPWVMLARGFSTGGVRTDVLPGDWDALFRGEYRPSGPAPKLTAARFGVSTPRRDPIH